MKLKWANACGGGWEVSLYQYLTNRQSTNIGELDIVSCCTNTLNLCSDSDLEEKTRLNAMSLFMSGAQRVTRLFVGVIVLVFVQLESLFGQKPKLWGFSKIEVELLKCKTFCGKLLYYGHFVMVYLLTDNMCVFKVE